MVLVFLHSEQTLCTMWSWTNCDRTTSETGSMASIWAQ